MNTLSTNPPVILDLDGPVATIRFNRPQSLNALDLDGFRAFGDAVARLGEYEGLRAVVIRGEGKAFMVGADLTAVTADIDHAAETVGAMIDVLHPAIIALGQLPVPVIAAAQGAVAGAGLSLMMGCDFTVADENTRFSLAYSRIGASLDGGGSWMLPRIVGRRKALQIALLADPFDAATALRLDLVDEVAPHDEFEAVLGRWCDRLANGPTHSYGRIKALLAASSTNDLPTQLDAERAAFLSCAGTDDFREGVTAFVEKRPAQFQGR
ncbi:MAG: enoyl-CoA hydratase-related protein [Alcaligenaceae bacterium]|nr:enoyl-CoA hydratase-related protein [Alcaligenaceae bacterium]